jgi:AcrR family transcriptional regulator
MMAPGRLLASEYARQLLLVLGFNAVIAGFLTLLMPHGFGTVLLTSQSIGLSIFSLSCAMPLLHLDEGKLRWARLAAIPLGGVAGLLLASLLGGEPVVAEIVRKPRQLAANLAGAVIFGAAISYYFHSREALQIQAQQLREQALQQATSERALAEANLKVLQAQMEPHFLFNTLSNVIGLIDDRPAQASRMLENLTAYLRGTLQRTRAGATTLGDEAALLRAYLEIHGVRMGKRLRWSVDVPDGLRPLPLPPLLLQPLVENALRHGLEGRPEGGEVSVRASLDGDRLVCEVVDTGLGLTGDPAPGIGLANVRARLAALYGPDAGMEVRPNEPRGLRLKLTIPIAWATLAALSPAPAQEKA